MKSCNMKKVNNILMLVTAFVLGMLVCFFCFSNKSNEKKNNEDLILNILKERNDYLSFKTEKLLKIFTENGIDTTAQQFLLLKKMDLISNYFGTILSSKKNYNSFSIDTIKSILGGSYVDLEDFYKIYPQNNTLIENEWYINLCFNIILNRYFEIYNENSLMINWGECIVIPVKDTVRIGDFFEADIYFSINDLKRTHATNFQVDTILFDSNYTFLAGNIYKEKAITKGLNTRKGLFPFFNGETTDYYPVDFSFYVK